MKIKLFLTSIFLILFTSSCFEFYPNGYEILDSQEKIVKHIYSGVIFPLKLQNFIRVQLNNFDKNGYDTLIGYNLNKKNLVVASIYIYPAMSDKGSEINLDVHCNEVKKYIIEHRSNVKEVTAESKELVFKNGSITGFTSIFEYDDKFQNKNAHVLSSLTIVKTKKWFYKIRLTKEFSTNSDLIGDTSDFISLIDLPTIELK